MKNYFSAKFFISQKIVNISHCASALQVDKTWKHDGTQINFFSMRPITSGSICIHNMDGEGIADAQISILPKQQQSTLIKTDQDGMAEYDGFC